LSARLGLRLTKEDCDAHTTLPMSRFPQARPVLGSRLRQNGTMIYVPASTRYDAMQYRRCGRQPVESGGSPWS